MTEEMRDEVGLIYITNDIAVSVSKKADYTCHIVWKILASNKVCVIDVRYKRQDALKTCELMLDLNTAYEPEEFITESGVIEKTIGPFLNVMMLQENNFLTLETVPSSVDIERRASSLQARMRAGQVYFDTHADWFYEFKQEYLKFPRAPRNDRVAAGAVFGQRMALLSRPVTRDEDWEEEITQWQRSHVKNGRSKVTGY
jgi:predicted phage terminase large subunit-like protein